MTEIPYDPSPLIKQLDGSTFGGFNCTMAADATSIVRALRGRKPAAIRVGAPWRPTPAYLRALTGDTSGGNTLTQAARVAMTGYGVDLDVRPGLDFDEVWRRLGLGFGLHFQHGYGPIRDVARLRGSETFAGNHDMFLNHIVRNPPGLPAGEYAYGFDPLTDGRRSGIAKGPLLYPKGLLREAGHELVVGRSRTETLYAGEAVWVAFTIDTGVGIVVPAAPTVYRYGGEPRSRGPYVVVVPGAGRYANIRSTPYIPLAGKPSNVVRTVLEGLALPYRVSQTTFRGTSVGGDRRWHGDKTGTRWVHHSMVRPA